MALSRRSLLRTLAAASALPLLPAYGRGSTPRNLIIVYAGGGWDPTWVFDPKPDSKHVHTGAGDEAAFGDDSLWLHPSRPSITDFFDRYGDLSAVVNGISVPALSHLTCTERMFTGVSEGGAADIGAIIGHELGSDTPVPYLVLQGVGRPGPFGSEIGLFGNRNQLRRLVMTDNAYPPAEGDWHRHFPTASETELVRSFVEARASRNYSSRAAMGQNARRVDDFLSGMDRSHALSQFSGFFSRSAGASLDVSEQIALAAEGLQVGVCRAIQLTASTQFDTHANNNRQSSLLDNTFDGLISLMETLESTAGESGSLLEETVVLVISEMGRTPLRNSNDGKDHWPYTSALIAGAGVRGGRVLGGTNETLTGVACDLQTGRPDEGGAVLLAENVLAGVVSLLGVSAEDYFPGAGVLRGFIA